MMNETKMHFLVAKKEKKNTKCKKERKTKNPRRETKPIVEETETQQTAPTNWSCSCLMF